MKRILLLTWTFLLLGILFYFGWIFFTQNKSDMDYSVKESTVFNTDELKEVLSNFDHILLTVGAEGCNMCDMLLASKRLNKYPVPKYYINKDNHNNNLLVSQALHSEGFPSSYVIDKEYNIIGIIKGMKNITRQLDSIIQNRTLINASHRSEQEKMNKKLGYSFKALMAYFENDLDNVYRNSMRSKSYGDYFFNNYLIYLCKNGGPEQDSVMLFKDAALKSLEGADIFIYESLIREIDPANELLELVDQSRSSGHVHNEHCNHKH